MSTHIHIGTSGWSYDDWVGGFYPDGAVQRDYLPTYAEHFDVVEVDSTYYRPPARRMVEGWRDRTPPHFRFAIKAPGEITHKKMLADCGREMDELLEALEPLGERTLCVLLQFGYFNKKTFSGAGPFFDRLDAFLEEYATRVPLAVEIRNKWWLGREYFDLLRRRGASAALAEHSWMPPVDEMIAKHDAVTGPFAYLRLIGDRHGIEKITTVWSDEVVDRQADLTRVAAALRTLAERVPVYTFANNHYAGHGPATARRLRRLLDDLA